PPSSLTKEPSWLLSERADAFINLGNYSQALNIANQILKQNATDLDGLEVKGEALLYQKKDAAALAIFNKLLLQEHHNNIDEAWLLDDKGTALWNLGNDTGAISTFNAAITSNPRDAQAYYNRATSFLNLDLHSPPNSPRSSQQQLTLKDLDRILQDLDTTLKIDPYHSDAKHLKALLTQGLDFEYIHQR
ncbi:MAG TPA: tetratricopeptide repeat protein, partial [Ktedonobacteraceae bacterium]